MSDFGIYFDPRYGDSYDFGPTEERILTQEEISSKNNKGQTIAMQEALIPSKNLEDFQLLIRRLNSYIDQGVDENVKDNNGRDLGWYVWNNYKEVRARALQNSDEGITLVCNGYPIENSLMFASNETKESELNMRLLTDYNEHRRILAEGKKSFEANIYAERMYVWYDQGADPKQALKDVRNPYKNTTHLMKEILRAMKVKNVSEQPSNSPTNNLGHDLS